MYQKGDSLCSQVYLALRVLVLVWPVWSVHTLATIHDTVHETAAVYIKP